MTDPPKKFSLRILFSVWWMCSLVLVFAYSAKLVALMSVAVEEVPIRSVYELATQTHTKIQLAHGTAFYGMLQVSYFTNHIHFVS